MVQNIIHPTKFVLIFLGMGIAILGALYSASGLLDKKGGFFKDLTQYLIFGVGGGIIIGIGFGAIGPLFSLVLAIKSTNDLRLYVSYTFAFLSIGLVLGIILGLLTGWGYTRIQTPNQFPETKREKRWTFVVAFCTLLFISVGIQIISFTIITSPSAHLTTSPSLNSRITVNIPLFLGCATSFIYQRYIHNLFESEDNIHKYTFQLIFIFINIFIFSSYIIIIRPYPGSPGTSSEIEASMSTATPIGIESIIMLHPNNHDPSPLWSLSKIISWARDFIFGFLITNELNHQREPETPQGKPSWIKFLSWSILLGICGVVLNYLILTYLFPKYRGDLSLLTLTGHIMKLTVLIGLIVGIRRGQIDEFIKQPKRAVFIFLVGLTVFGLYTFSSLFLNPPSSSINFGKLFSNTIYSSLTNSIPIGLLIGCVYGFRPFFSKIQDLPVERLGEIFGKIGVILTVISIILLNIQEIIQ